MHSINVVHRDLKLENVLIDRKTKQTKIIDFGYSTRVKSVKDTKLNFICGTPIYMSPELAQRKEYAGGPNDIWALGVMLFILIVGKKPFYGAFEDDLYRKIIQCKFRFPDFLFDEKGQEVQISDGAKRLVRKMLTVDAKLRPTAEHILKDPWLHTEDPGDSTEIQEKAYEAEETAIVKT